MKRSLPDDQQNKNKRFSYNTTNNDGDKKPSMSPSPRPSMAGYQTYQSSMNWIDPRIDPRNHGNLAMFNQWNGGSPQSGQGFPPAVYNPLQPPPPPLPLDRPPMGTSMYPTIVSWFAGTSFVSSVDTPPPPPPHGMGMAHLSSSPNGMRRPIMNPNMRRRPPMGNGMPGPGPSG